MENPVRSLVPKDTEVGPDPNGFRGAAEGWKNADLALHPQPTPTKMPERAAPTKQDKTNSQKPYGSQGKEKRIDTSYPGTPMPKMHSGGEVTHTGPHILKKGEHVLTGGQKDKIHHALGLAVHALSHEPDAEPKKEIREMRIRKAHDGSHVIEHHHAHPMHPMEEHTAQSTDDLHDHIEHHWGEPNDGEMESENEMDGSPAVAAMQKDLGYTK